MFAVNLLLSVSKITWLAVRQCQQKIGCVYYYLMWQKLHWGNGIHINVPLYLRAAESCTNNKIYNSCKILIKALLLLHDQYRKYKRHLLCVQWILKAENYYFVKRRITTMQLSLTDSNCDVLLSTIKHQIFLLS